MMESNKQLRKFGLLSSGYFIFFAMLINKFHLKHISSLVWIFLATVFLVILTAPQLLKPIRVLWNTVLGILQWINIRLLLGMIFFFIFTPISFFRKLKKEDVLSSNYKTNESSYRVDIKNNYQNDLRRLY